jgi:hypothetical protein
MAKEQELVFVHAVHTMSEMMQKLQLTQRL